MICWRHINNLVFMKFVDEWSWWTSLTQKVLIPKAHVPFQYHMQERRRIPLSKVLYRSYWWRDLVSLQWNNDWNWSILNFEFLIFVELNCFPLSSRSKRQMWQLFYLLLSFHRLMKIYFFSHSYCKWKNRECRYNYVVQV